MKWTSLLHFYFHLYISYLVLICPINILSYLPFTLLVVMQVQKCCGSISNPVFKLNNPKQRPIKNFTKLQPQEKDGFQLLDTPSSFLSVFLSKLLMDVYLLTPNKAFLQLLQIRKQCHILFFCFHAKTTHLGTCTQYFYWQIYPLYRFPFLFLPFPLLAFL